MTTFLFKLRTIALVLAAALAPFVLAFVAGSIAGPAPQFNHTLHESLEIAGSCFALTVALLLLLHARHEPDAPHLRWVAAGLVVMGLMDGAHALAPYGGSWSWIRHAATVAGGLLFAMVWVPVPRVAMRRGEPVIVGLAVLTILFVTAIGRINGTVPAAFDVDGYLPLAKVADIVGALGFAASAAFFVRRALSRGESPAVMFALHSTLFATSGLLITFSHIWSAQWWIWHYTRMAAYLILLVSGFRIVTELFRRIGRQAAQLREANRALHEENLVRQRAEAALKAANETLEVRIAERTSELQVANRVLEDSRLTAVKLMEEALAARRRAEGATAELRDEIAERQRAEEALRNSEALYRAIGESIDYGIWVCAPDGRNTYASDSFLKMVGMTQEQCSNFGWGDVLHPDDAARTIEAWKECVRTGGLWDIEHRFRGVDGEWHDVLARGVPVKNDRGEIIYWVGINLDISRRKRAESALREREEQFRLVFEHARDAVFWADAATGTIVRCNRRAEEMMERPRDELIGLHQSQLHPPDRPMHREFVAAVAHPVVSEIEAEVLSASGRRIPVLIGTSVVTIGSRTIIQGVFRDITERRKAEEALRASEEQARLAMEAGQAFSFTWIPATDEVRRSENCRAILGLVDSPTHDTGRNFFQHIHPEDRAYFERTLGALAHDHAAYTVQYRFLRPDGGIVTLLESARGVFGEDGAMLRLVGMTVDITERRRAEEALRASEEKLRRAHELLDAVTAASGVTVAAIDTAFRYTYVNQAYRDEILKLGGQPLSVGSSLDDAFPDRPDLQKTVRESWEQVLRGESTTQTTELGDPNRYRRTYSVRRTPIRNPAGELVGAGEVAFDITAQVEMEEKLRQSERDLARAQSVSHTGSWRLDIQRNLLTWSEENHRIFDVPPGTPLTYETFLSLVHPDDRHLVDEQWRAALEGHPYDIEHRLLLGDTVKWVRETAELDLAPDGTLLGGFGTTQDITDRKKTAEVLAWLASFPELNPNLVIEADLDDGSVYYVNPSARRLFPDLAAHGLAHPLLAGVPAMVAELPAGGATAVTEVQTHGSCYHLSANRPDARSRVRVYGVDITRRKQAEDALERARAELEIKVNDRTARLREINAHLRDEIEMRQRKEAELSEAEFRYRTVVETSQDWTYWEKPDHTLRYCSPTCAAITGYTSEEIVADPSLLSRIVHPDHAEAWMEHRHDAYLPAPHGALQFRIVRKDGAIRWIEHSCHAVMGADGAFLGVRVGNRDVTARHRAELETERLQRELAHITRVTTVGQLSASLAHELNQPLAAILCNAQAAQTLLGRPGIDAAELRAIIEDIIDDDERAGQVIRRLRALFRKEAGERIPLDANMLIRDTLELLKSELVMKDVSLNLKLTPGLPAVLGSRVELQQVVLNLVMNAIDALAEVPRHKRNIRVAATPGEAGWVHLSISDTGVGLPEDIGGRLGEPFLTTKPAGMGMGLAISRSIIENHGGRLTAENNPGGGAIFRFTLPTIDGATPE